MDGLYYFISQQGSLIKVLIVIIFVALVLFIRKTRIRLYKPKYDDNDMPANIWFYSQLINYEIGSIKATYKNLYQCFMQFLCRKYYIYKVDLRKQTIFDLVAAKEDNPQILEIYGEIYNSIEDLKGKMQDELISYIKTIKPMFNKDNLNEWIEDRKSQQKCNDC